MTKKKTKKIAKSKKPKIKAAPKKKKVSLKAGARSLARSQAHLSEERIGILGGGFNPIHAGHLNSAMTAKAHCDLGRVIFVPALNPPHRQMIGPGAQDRLDLVAEAIRPYAPDLALDDREVKRGGVSYTFETLKSFNKTHKAENIYFIMGADAFMDFPHWKNFEELLKLANYIVTTRPGSSFSLAAVDLPSGLEQYVKASDTGRVVLTSGRTIERLELDDIDVSATDLRKKLRNGQDVSKWIPNKVMEIINERGLYRRSSPLVSDYREFALFCGRKASDRKALDLKIYDMTRKNSYADFSIICSATSSRHGSATAQGILDAVRDEYGLLPISVEGLNEGQWVLVDFGVVVIHIFQDNVRQQYRIEELWKNCPQFQTEMAPVQAGRN